MNTIRFSFSRSQFQGLVEEDVASFNRIEVMTLVIEADSSHKRYDWR